MIAKESIKKGCLLIQEPRVLDVHSHLKITQLLQNYFLNNLKNNIILIMQNICNI